MDGSRRGEARPRPAAASFQASLSRRQTSPLLQVEIFNASWKRVRLYFTFVALAHTRARGLSDGDRYAYAGDNRGGQSYNARPDYLVRVSNVVNSYWQRRWIYESQEMAVRSGFAICDRPRRVFCRPGMELLQVLLSGKGDGDELWGGWGCERWSDRCCVSCVSEKN